MAEIRAMADETRPAFQTSSGPVHLGDTLYYKHWTNEWVKATVVDRVAAEHNEGMMQPYAPPRTGTVHLCIDLNPERHFSANVYAYRRNVSEGLGLGDWQRQPPEGWEAAKRDAEYRAQVEKETRLRVWSEAAGEER